LLAFFFISVLLSGKLDFSLLFNIKPDAGQSSFLPHGLAGIFPAIPFAIWFYLAIEELPLAAEESHDPKRDIPRATIWGLTTLVVTGALIFLPHGLAGIFPAIPFAIWFYLAIEELPLAAEESHDPKRDIPRATIWGLTTLVVTGALIFLLNPAIGGGAKTIGVSATPLFDGFKAVFGSGTGAALLALIGLVGLIASFFTIIYAYGRNTYSLSRAGYFPHFLSVTHPTLKTPHIALIAGGVVGLVLACLLTYLGTQKNLVAGQVVGALLYMAVFGAVVSYAMQCASFIFLRRRLPNIERPYRSPVGVWGAGI